MLMIHLIAEIALLVLLPCLLWRLTGKAVPLAVLPIVVGMLLSLMAHHLEIDKEVLKPSGLGQLVGVFGVLLLAFAAGLEVQHEARAPIDARLCGTAAVALIIPFAVGTLIALLRPFREALWLAGPEAAWSGAAAFGLCISISALPVLVGIVRELPREHQSLGRTALKIAVVDDAVLWTGLAVLLIVGAGAVGVRPGLAEGAAVLVLAALVLGRAALGERRLAAPVAWTVAAAYLAAGPWATAQLGLHEFLGAYFAGAVAPRAAARAIPAERLGFLALVGLAPLFFGARGLSIDATTVDWSILATAFVLCAAATAAKLLAVLAYPPRDLSRSDVLGLGALLQCKGLMEIVAAMILHGAGLLTATAFATLVTVAVISTTLTMPLFRLLVGLERWGARSRGRPSGAGGQASPRR